MEYFQLYHTVISPIPLQFQTLSEKSKSYETGSQYAEYIRTKLLVKKQVQPEVFVFEPYVHGQKQDLFFFLNIYFHFLISISYFFIQNLVVFFKTLYFNRLGILISEIYPTLNSTKDEFTCHILRLVLIIIISSFNYNPKISLLFMLYSFLGLVLLNYLIDC